MISNHLRITLRHLAKQKLNTSLHIVGLTLGISVCLLIALFIRHELSFDRYHKDYERIYRVTSSWTDAGKTNYHFSTPVPMAEALRAEGTAFESVVMVHPQAKSVVEVNSEKKFLQEKILVVSPEFLDVFTIKVIDGDASASLRKPYYALLTRTTANKFFGSDNAVGKTFQYKNEFTVTVGAVIEDMPANTHLDASIILSYAPNENYVGTGFGQWSSISGTSAYVLLKPEAHTDAVQKLLTSLADKHVNSDPNLPKHVRADFALQRLDRIHFEADFAGGGPWGGAINTEWLWIFGSIGFAVLFLACINFVNLSTAQALTRAKEVGVRKSVGAGKQQLILQFLTEAWLLALLSGVLAVTLVQAFLPYLNDLVEKQIPFNPLSSPLLLLAIFAGIMVVGLLAGVYPAWVIARFNPSVTLKSHASTTGAPGSQWLRSGLMVTQFVISAALLIAVLLISEQVRFLRTKNLGFDKENVLNIPIPFGQTAKLETLLGDVSHIKDYSFASATPTAEGHWGTIMSLTNQDDPNRQSVTMILADDHFAKLYDLNLVAGRFNTAADTNYVSSSLPQNEQIMKCVVNETLVKKLGFASNEEALGKRYWCGMNSGNAEIIGVVKDFNTSSLHQSIQPLMLFPAPRLYSQVGIKLHSRADLPAAIAEIEKRWKNAFPDEVFEFNFLDDQINSYYKAEMRINTLFRIFTGLAMLISCLGLWGLASYAAQQRTKEIGIRKILGASVNAIVILLSKDFAIMVLIALLIACPLSYFVMNDWLSNFAFHVEIGVKIFLIAGVASIVIALLVVSFQAVKAAFGNPVDSLKSE